MNMLVSATAVALASPAAIASSNEAGQVLVVELLPPPDSDSRMWSGFTLDGSSQRWAFGAGSDGEIIFAHREDRPSVDGPVCWLREPAPPPVREAVRSAIAERVGPVPPDPILTAIEQHKLAFRLSQERGRIECGTVDVKGAPGYDPVKCKAVQKAARAADDAAADAAKALTTIQPSTMAGLLALMRHVEAFNAGAYFLEDAPGDWRSAPMFWPTDFVDDDEIHLFGYAVLANVRHALEAMGSAAQTSLPPIAGGGADGELLRLGDDLARVEQEVLATTERADALPLNASDNHPDNLTCEDALDRFDAAWALMRDIRATTLAGLIAKARYGQREMTRTPRAADENYNSDAEDCGMSIITDLTMMGQRAMVSPTRDTATAPT